MPTRVRQACAVSTQRLHAPPIAQKRFDDSMHYYDCPELSSPPTNWSTRCRYPNSNANQTTSIAKTPTIPSPTGDKPRLCGKTHPTNWTLPTLVKVSNFHPFTSAQSGDLFHTMNVQTRNSTRRLIEPLFPFGWAMKCTKQKWTMETVTSVGTVQLVGCVLTHKRGLSPVGDWIEEGLAMDVVRLALDVEYLQRVEQLVGDDHSWES